MTTATFFVSFVTVFNRISQPDHFHNKTLLHGELQILQEYNLKRDICFSIQGLTRTDLLSHLSGQSPSKKLNLQGVRISLTLRESFHHTSSHSVIFVCVFVSIFLYSFDCVIFWDQKSHHFPSLPQSFCSKIYQHAFSFIGYIDNYFSDGKIIKCYIWRILFANSFPQMLTCTSCQHPLHPFNLPQSCIPQ